MAGIWSVVGNDVNSDAREGDNVDANAVEGILPGAQLEAINSCVELEDNTDDKAVDGTFPDVCSGGVSVVKSDLRVGEHSDAKTVDGITLGASDGSNAAFNSRVRGKTDLKTVDGIMFSACSGAGLLRNSG